MPDAALVIKDRNSILIDRPCDALKCFFHIFNRMFQRTGTLLNRRHPVFDVSEPTFDSVEPTFNSVESTFDSIEPKVDSIESLIDFCKASLYSINQILNRFRQVLYDTHHIHNGRLKLC